MQSNLNYILHIVHKQYTYELHLEQQAALVYFAFFFRRWLWMAQWMLKPWIMTLSVLMPSVCKLVFFNGLHEGISYHLEFVAFHSNKMTQCCDHRKGAQCLVLSPSCLHISHQLFLLYFTILDLRSHLTFFPVHWPSMSIKVFPLYWYHCGET